MTNTIPALVLAETTNMYYAEPMKRRLPIGIQDFAKIREGNYVYVDKTAQIYDLLTGSGAQFFLSRPRRFGKSLLCSTLGAIFAGKRELFAGLAIDSLDWEWKKHPVIHIDLNPGDYAGGGIMELSATLNRSIERYAQEYAVPLEEDSPSNRFMRLIQLAAERHNERVAVIIDEPLLSTIDHRELPETMRSALKGFYSVLKSSDAYLKFVLLTGVKKFAQVSVFSDLNHLTDISSDPRYSDICGITQEELERDFAPEVDKIIQNGSRDREHYLAELKRFYNGYRFSEKPLTVYNPFGLLNHLDKGGKFLPYWFETETSTVLIKLIEKQNIDIVNLGKMCVRHEDFRMYNAETLEAEPVLYQSGYLTITGYDEELNIFNLDYPNAEVRGSFAESLIEKYLRVPGQNLHTFIVRLSNAIYDGDVDGILNTLPPFFASIPYDIIKDAEKQYQTVVYLLFTMLGLQCRSEVQIAAGRIDTLVETDTRVYCFEFKLNGTAEEALAQIDTKEYLLPWTGSGKKLFKVGVDFDKDKRNIGRWKSALE